MRAEQNFESLLTPTQKQLTNDREKRYPKYFELKKYGLDVNVNYKNIEIQDNKDNLYKIVEIQGTINNKHFSLKRKISVDNVETSFDAHPDERFQENGDYEEYEGNYGDHKINSRDAGLLFKKLEPLYINEEKVNQQIDEVEMEQRHFLRAKEKEEEEIVLKEKKEEKNREDGDKEELENIIEVFNKI